MLAFIHRFQEIVPLSAGNVLGSENGKVSMQWNSLIRAALNKTIIPSSEDELSKVDAGELQKVHPLKKHNSLKNTGGGAGGGSGGGGGGAPMDFQCIISKQMVGIFITVWARGDLCLHIKHATFSCVGCGIMGCLGNKGSVAVRFCLHETNFCFVCSHLASGGKEGDERQRNADAADILSRTTFPRGPLHDLPRKILHHEYLKAELMEGHIFEGWQEEAINFAPTYKYNPNSDDYYGCNQDGKGKKRRTPAWCDRIIWFGKGLKQNQYSRGECRLSDHRPVRAIFTANVKVLRSSNAAESLLSNRVNHLSNHFNVCISTSKFLCNGISSFQG
ncbi:hypothetical protein LguiB_007471 [Lonicera macranthoides]